MSSQAIPDSDLLQRIVEAVRVATKPVTFKGLAKLVRAKEEPVRAALLSAVDAGQLYRWPDYRKSQCFWHVSADQKAREAVLYAAAGQALSTSDLSKSAKKRLPGFSDRRLATVVSGLLADKELQSVPAFASGAKLLVRTGDRDAYFKTALAFIEKKFKKADFDLSGLFTQNSPPRETPPDSPAEDTGTDAAALILKAVESLEPVRGVPVSTLRLRNHLAKLSKQQFDEAALELRGKQQVFLSQHADPWNISPEDKDLLIDGKDGTFYVAIAIR